MTLLVFGTIYMTRYFQKSGTFLVEHIRDENNPSKTTKQKAFLGFMIVVIYINLFKNCTVDVFETLNLTVWQMTCPSWYITCKQFLEGTYLFHNFFTVMVYDILVFFFLSSQHEEGENHMDYLTSDISGKSYSLLVDQYDNYRKLDINRSIIDSHTENFERVHRS